LLKLHELEKSSQQGSSLHHKLCFILGCLQKSQQPTKNSVKLSGINR